MNFKARLGIVLGLVALSAVSSCGPREGSPSALVRVYVGPGRLTAALAQPVWWTITLDYRDNTFKGFVWDRVGSTQYFWSGRVEGLPSDGGIRLTVESCNAEGQGTDTNCTVGTLIYGYEIPEALLQLSDPRSLARSITLISPELGTEIGSTSIKTVATVFPDADNPTNQYMIADLQLTSLSSSNYFWDITGNAYQIQTSGGFTTPTPLPTVMASFNGWELIGPLAPAEFIAGNSKTGLYAGISSTSSYGWVGFSGSSAVSSSDLAGASFLGFSYMKSDPGCGTSLTPALGYGFEAFRLFVSGSSQMSTNKICDLNSLASEGSANGSFSFRVPTSGKIEVYSSSGSYNIQGYLHRYGGRMLGAILEGESSGTASPQATFRLIAQEWER